MKLSLILLVLLILSVAGNWIQYRSAKTEEANRYAENATWQAEYERIKGLYMRGYARKDSVISALRNERSADSVRYGLKHKSLQRSINALKARIVIPAPVQDSVIDLQDDLIASMDAQIDTVYRMDNVIFDSLTANYETAKALFVEQLKRSMRLEDKLHRERSKNWSLGVSGGIDYLGRPTVMVGIHRSLFKFSLKKKR
jgi:hypothetical protein